MPLTQPAEVVNGRAVQMLRVDAPPTAPYTLHATLALPAGTVGNNRLAVRALDGITTAWFQTQSELIARTKTHDYYEVFVDVTSGTATRFAVDLVTGNVDLTFVARDAGGYTVTRANRPKINTDAWNLLNLGHTFGGGLQLKLSATTRGGGAELLSDRAFLTGFGEPWTGVAGLDSPQANRMWTVPRSNIGNHRWGPLARTLYKHIPMKVGGDSGYLHIWMTAFANTPEVQVIMNWHNGVIEERSDVPGTGGGEIEDPVFGEVGSPAGGFGVARMRDVIFTRLQLTGFLGIQVPEANITFSGATYTDATKRIVKTGAFTNYTHRAGNRILVSSGTGATVGDYEIAGKVDANTIALVTSIGSAADAQTDIEGYVIPYWTMTPELMDGSNPADSCFFVASPTAGVPSDVQVLVRPISNTDLNRLHPLLITNERSFRFAIHPQTVTPYTKVVTARADWSRGGWGFSPLGAPDYDAVNSTAVGMDLTAEAGTAKTRLRTLLPYKVDGAQSEGMNPAGAFCPGSYEAYGGETGGVGIWHDYGMKSSWDARKTAIEILKVEQLRLQSRLYGCMYYNLTGMPVNPWAHSQRGNNAPWSRFDRRFQGSASNPKDAPFSIGPIRNRTARAIRLLEADYNPGPRGNEDSTPQDATGFVPSTAIKESLTPDWWAWGDDDNGDGVGDGFAGDIFVADYQLTLRNTAGPGVDALGVIPDDAVPVVCEIQGAGAFDETKSVVFEIIGTGELDLAVTEQLTVTGPDDDIQNTLAFVTQAEFKTVSSIKVISVTGTLLSTERFRFGRASVGIPDYFGDGNITALDNQHQIRFTATNKALFLLTNDPLAKLYLWMNAMDQRMCYWEGGGAAFRLSSVERGGLGRGSNSTREHGWCADTMASFAAIAAGHYSLADGRQGAINLLFGTTDISFGLARWIGVMGSRFVNGLMSNGANASYYNKNSTKAPTSIVNGHDTLSRQAFYIIAPREQSFIAVGLLNLANVWLPSTGYEGVALTLAAVETMLLNQQSAYLNFFNKTSGGVTGLYHTYLPCAARKTGFRVSDLSWNESTLELTESGAFTNYTLAAGDTCTVISGTGATKGVYAIAARVDQNRIRLTTSIGAGAGGDIVANIGRYVPVETIADNTGVWEVYGPTQADLPEFNPITGLAINPITYPTLTTNRFAAGVAGNSAQMNSGAVGAGTPFTIANASGDANFATGVLNGSAIPTPVRLTITGGATFTSSKRRTFRITGTGFVNGGANLNVGAISEDLFVQGYGAATQAFQTIKHFVTVTSITMIADGGSGTTVVGETFAFGVANVGLRLNPAEKVGGKNVPGTEAVLIGEAQGFHLAIALAVQKYLAERDGVSSTSVDTMIQRWTGTASEALALAAIQGYTEYGGTNPSERIEHCSKLLWQLGMNTKSVAPVADFDKTAASGAAPLRVGFSAKPIGRIVTYEWDWENDGTYDDNGKYATHTFATPATYTVKLRVTDADGTTATTTQTVTVS